MHREKADSGFPVGDFTIFGFLKNTRKSLRHELQERLAIVPRCIDFGDRGYLFFYSTYGQVGESDTNFLLKMGFARSSKHESLSSQQIIDQKLIGCDFVEEKELKGNAVLVALSKTEPSFSAYKTLMAVPQLYYSASSSGIICSDRLKSIVLALDHIELNEDILPMHFLFRTVIGPYTYFRNINRMLPGQFMKWTDGDLNLRQVRDLQFHTIPSYHHIDKNNLKALYKSLSDVINDYGRQAESAGENFGNLLSGGVDSSLIQCILNENFHDKPARSFSFAPKAASFSFEIDYTRKAIEHFHTEHTFVNFAQDDYPDLLTKTIDALAYPPLLPSEPGMYAVAQYAQTRNIPIRFYFTGQGAESTFGYPFAKRIKILEYLSHIPAGAQLIKIVGRLLRPLNSYGQILFERGLKIQGLNDLDSFWSPSNTYAVYIDLTRALRCFGEKVLQRTLEYRRDLAGQYIHSAHPLEKVFVIDMVTDSYDAAAERHQLFLGSRKELIHPFLDEDIIGAGFRFDPDIRYINRFKEKYLLKILLHQKTGLAATWKPKGATQFYDDFDEWMRVGSLRPLVDDIELPGFINRRDFEKLVQKPDLFLWSLLVLDLFKKRILKSHQNNIHKSIP